MARTVVLPAPSLREFTPMRLDFTRPCRVVEERHTPGGGREVAIEEAGLSGVAGDRGQVAVPISGLFPGLGAWTGLSGLLPGFRVLPAGFGSESTDALVIGATSPALALSGG
jgi:hypothetical protein